MLIIAIIQIKFFNIFITIKKPIIIAVIISEVQLLKLAIIFLFISIRLYFDILNDFLMIFDHLFTNFNHYHNRLIFYQFHHHHFFQKLSILFSI